MATGAGRQLAAQHSHSLEGWYAHVPGIKVVAPATVEDAYGMLISALDDPDPVVVFEHVALYNTSTDVDVLAATDISKAAVRRAGTDVTLVTYGGCLSKALDAANELSLNGINCEVIDLRALRPLDDATIIESVTKTHRAVVIDEAWRTGSFAAEITARLVEEAFYELDAPIARVCSAEVPMPYAKHLEQAALPQVDKIVAAVERVVGEGP
jgi:pyruvate dehydrogenase E1 component beta subunit